jgi:organic hydroperoxide reductase OsmC/OhrA
MLLKNKEGELERRLHSSDPDGATRSVTRPAESSEERLLAGYIRSSIVSNVMAANPGNSRKHQYCIASRWTGNLGSGTSHYTAYSRDHELNGHGKLAPIAGSSDRMFRGDPARYNPEEMLLGALSACHMLWVLHLCADARITVTEYSDEATGEVVEHADGSGEFTRVTLHPRMVIADAARVAEAIEIHDRAHDVCCLARSVNFPVAHEPAVIAPS